MKFQKLMLGLLAGAMFASCSDDVSQSSNVGPDAKGSGYVSIAIGMPTGAVTRANDQFDDGLPAEYKVNNVAVLFFTGREESATFLKAYKVSNEFDFDKPEDDQITSINKVTFPIDVTENSESLWAVAVVNYNQVFTIEDDHTLSIVATGNKFSGNIQDFMALKTSANLYFSAGANFFMTNTPYTTSPGSGVSSAPTGFIHFLAPVDKEKIADTKEKAKANPAAEIYVERAVAKVDVDADSYRAISKVSKIEWVIDNTEPESYVARNLVYNNFDPTKAPVWMAYTQSTDFLESLRAANIKTPQNYRFVGNTAFDANLYYRLYFGYDPNGNGINGGNLKVLSDGDIDSNTFKKLDDAQYCNENTFDVEHQDYLNTTRVILKVTFEGGDFFTRGIDRATKYLAKDAQMTLAHFVLDNADIVKIFTDYFKVPTTITIEDLDCTLNGATGTATNNWFDIGYTIENGRLHVSSINLFDGTESRNKIDIPEDIDVTDIINSINSQVTFNAYVGGVSYYAIRIKHFGDDLTPWIEPEGETLTTADSYPGYDSNNYLGRYGVLRNNWYHLSISAIDKFGEPLVGDLKLDKTPDDKVDPEKAISCKINILSWAKRNQSVEF